MGKWKLVKLDEVCEILDSQRVPITASERKKGPYPYYGANGIQDYVDGYLFDDELVLLAEDGGNFGSKDRPIAYRVSGKCWVNNHAHVLKAKNGLDIDFLCYSLMFYDVMPLISGTTRAKLTQTAMRKMCIPFPPLIIQTAIVDKLCNAHKLIDFRKAQIEKLDLLIKSQFIQMFGDPIANKVGWDITCLGEAVDIIDGDRGKEYPKSNDFFSEEHCLFLNTANVTKSGFNFEKTMFITKEKDTALRKGQLQRGDLVFTTRGTVGNIAFYGHDVPYDNVRINSGMVILRPKENKLNENYLMCLLRNKHLYANYLSGTAQPQMPIGSMSKIPIPIPPQNLQARFSNFVQQVEQQKALLQQSLAKMEENYKSLMQKCFRGEIFS